MAAWAMLVANGPGIHDTPLDRGREIYINGQGADAVAISLFGAPIDAAKGQFTCSSCHGEAGRGDSEGGIVAPALTSFASMSPDAARWALAAVLAGERKLDGSPVAEEMPRYRFSPSDFAALVEYVRTFPNPPVPGLSANAIIVGVDMEGSGLTHAERGITLSELQAQSASFGEEGLFGRRVVFIDIASDTRHPFAVLSWRHSADGMAPISLSVRPPESPGKDNGSCGSMQPDVAQQQAALAEYIEDQSISARIHKSSAIDPDHSDGARHYYFTDLLGPAVAEAGNADNIHLIVAAPVDLQVETTRDLMARHDVSPAKGGRIAAMTRAAFLLLNTLARAGRTIDVKSSCEDLRKSARRNWVLYSFSNSDAERLDVKF